MRAVIITIAVIACIGIAHGGIGTLSAREEEEVLNHWRLYCDPDRPLTPLASFPWIHCKPSEDQLEEVVNHKITAADSGNAGEQIVYIRPPPIKYTHNVQIQGGDGVAPKTKIYVLPQKAEHELNSQYVPGDVATEKPSVYFLKSDGKTEVQPLRYGSVATGRAGYRSG